jgi:type II secretory ATPase GspE/PulE/Tfp pilus assembly ATPase PilB-like protein
VQSLLTAHAVLGAEPLVLVSWWKPALLLIPFMPWAWLVSKVFDKHCARWHLPREQWGTIHLAVGAIAILAAISLPMKSEASYWAGLGIMIVILAADVAVFINVTNKDERVPEAFHLKFATLFRPEKPKDDKKKAVGGKSELAVKGADKALVAVPEAGTPEYDVRVAAENVVLRAQAARASQVDFDPAGNTYRVTFMIDGVRVPAVLVDPAPAKDGAPPPPPPGVMAGAEAMKVLDFWRGAAKHDVADRRKKQTGDVAIERGTNRNKIRVSSIGGQAGLRATLLFDPEAAVRRKFEGLGLLEPQAKAVTELVADGKGVVLVAAPPDQGRTTTLYTLVKQHDAYTKNVQTLEIDVQDTIEGVRQNSFDPFAEGAEFSTTTRSMLRRDPDVVGIAELPDAATAKEIAKADGERTRCYVSFKADNSLQAIAHWMKLVGDAEMGAKVLRGVISQRLVRKLCTNCRVAYQPSPEMLKKFGLPADRIKQLFKKGGQVLVKNKPETCPACGGVGFVGLEGCFEVFPIGDAERALIKAGNYQSLRQEFRKKQLPEIQQSALRKALDGTTSIEEMVRVTVEADAAAKPKPDAAPPPPKQPEPSRGA